MHACIFMIVSLSFRIASFWLSLPPFHVQDRNTSGGWRNNHQVWNHLVSVQCDFMLVPVTYYVAKTNLCCSSTIEKAGVTPSVPYALKMKQTLCEQYREEGREKGTRLRDGRIKDERMRDSDVYIHLD